MTLSTSLLYLPIFALFFADLTQMWSCFLMVYTKNGWFLMVNSLWYVIVWMFIIVNFCMLLVMSGSLWLLWVGWFFALGNTRAASNMLWLSMMAMWLSQMDFASTSAILLALCNILLLGTSLITKMWMSWSNYAYMAMGTLLFMCTTMIFMTTDSLMVFIAVEILHLMMATLALRTNTLSRILMYLAASWALTILVVLMSLWIGLLHAGEMTMMPLFELASIMEADGVIYSLIVLSYMLLMGKLYILPWYLLVSMLYSSVEIDLVLLLAMAFTVHFGMIMVWSIAGSASPHLLGYLGVMTVVSIILTVGSFLYTTSMTGFLGLSFCVMAHTLMLVSILSDSITVDMGLLILILYSCMTVSTLALLHLNSTSESALTMDGLLHVNPVSGIVLLSLLCGYLGYPPSLFLGLKILSVYSAYLASGMMWLMLVFLSMPIAYAYLRLVLRLMSSLQSTTDSMVTSHHKFIYFHNLAAVTMGSLTASFTVMLSMF